MAQTAPPGEVHSWHISVPIGESAIHLLTKSPAPTSSNRKSKPVIHRAVLIDGGKPHKAAARAIRDIIAVIEEKYDFADDADFEDTPHYGAASGAGPAKKSLRFDSIVISHWDTDHYEGVFGLLEQGFKKCFDAWKKAHPPPPPPTPAPPGSGPLTWETVLSGQYDPSKPEALIQTPNPPEAVVLPCWYLKYKKTATGGTPPSTATATPPVVWQASQPGTPSAETLDSVLQKFRAGGYEPATSIYVSNPISQTAPPLGSVGPWDGTATHSLVALSAIGTASTASIGASLSVKIDVLTSTAGLERRTVLLPHLGNLFYDHTQYIGVDLFTGTKSDSTVAGPLQLVEAFNVKIGGNSTEGPKQPGFFIVAGNRHVIGNTALGGAKPALPQGPKFDGGKSSSGSAAGAAPGTGTGTGTGASDTPGPGTADVNGRSIVAMAMVKRAKVNGFDVLHYTGADVSMDVENAIGNWLVKSARGTAEAPGPTADPSFVALSKTMKLSRHGSRGAATSGLLNALHSRYYFVSPAQQGAKRHPDLETVLVLYAQHAYWARLLLQNAKTSPDGSADLAPALASLKASPPFNLPAGTLPDSDLLALFAGLDTFLLTPRLPLWLRDPAKAPGAAQLEGTTAHDVDWVNDPVFVSKTETVPGSDPAEETTIHGDYGARLDGGVPDPVADFRGWVNGQEKEPEADALYDRLAGHISEIWPQICDVHLPRGKAQREKALWFRLGENAVDVTRLLGDYSLMGVGYGPSDKFIHAAEDIIAAEAPEAKPLPDASPTTQFDTGDPDNSDPARKLDEETEAKNDFPLWVASKRARLPAGAPAFGDVDECVVLVPDGTDTDGSDGDAKILALAPGSNFEKFVRLLPAGYVVVEEDSIARDPWGSRLQGMGLGISSVALDITVPEEEEEDEDADEEEKPAIFNSLSAEVTIPGTTASVVFTAKPNPTLIQKYGMLELRPPTEPTEILLKDLTEQFIPATAQLPFDSSIKTLLDPERSGLFFQADALSTSYLRVQVDATDAAVKILQTLSSAKLLPTSITPTAVEKLVFTCLKKSTTIRLGSEPPEEEEEEEEKKEAPDDGTKPEAGNEKKEGEKEEKEKDPKPNAGKYVSSVTYQTSIFCEIKTPTALRFWLIFEPDGSYRVIFEVGGGGLGQSTSKVLNLEGSDSLPDDLDMDEAATALVPSDTKFPSDLVFRVDVGLGGAKGFTVKLSCLFKLFGMDFLTSLAFPNPRIAADLYETPVANKDLPWYNEWDYITDNTPKTGDATIKDLTGDSVNHDGLGLKLEKCHLEGALLGPSKNKTVQGNLVAKATLDLEKLDLPLVIPDTLELQASFLKEGTSPAEWAISAGAEWALDNDDDARLSLGGSYTNGQAGGWVLTGDVVNLSFAAMADNFFPADDKSALKGLLESLTVRQLGIRYLHPNAKAADRILNVAGTVEMGTEPEKIVNLKFQYNLVSKAPPSTPPDPTAKRTSQWTFVATLDTGPGSSLLDVIDAFIPGEDILDVINEIPLVSDYAVPAKDETGNALKLQVKSTAEAVIMVLSAQIHTALGTLTAMFVQYKLKAPKATAGQPHKTDVKRYIRVRIEGLPTFKNIPVVGEIGPPLDALDYVFVQDKPEKPAAGGNTQTVDQNTTGFTSAEILEINKVLKITQFILAKEAQSSAQTQNQQGNPGKIVLRGGHHFMAINDGKVILDHMFGSGSKSPAKNPATAANPPGGKAVTPTAAPNNTGTEVGPTFGSSKKSSSGLSISNIGIELRNENMSGGTTEKYVFILIGATAMLGGLELEMEGLGVGLPLKKLLHPDQIELSDLRVTISGLGVNFSRGAMTISGGFTIQKTEDPDFIAEEYMGGIFISGIGSYALTGIGGYRSQNPTAGSTAKAFKSVFAYARIDGILFTIEIGEISGVAASFGYNYDMKVPTGATIEDFPLLARPGEPTNIMDLISASGGTKSFKHWLTPGDKSFFFSFGLTVSSCHIIRIEAAVLVRAASSDSFSISIVGRGTASFPPSNPGTKSLLTFLYVEIGFVATLDITGGSFSVEAQLGPKSHILTEDCRLTGGFAFRSWFPPSPYAGDWYFSVGGFHPAFAPPNHWLPAPPRVAITWQPLPALKIRGSGFFAITPKTIMGGGELSASFSAKIFFAEFRVWASFLINYTPFFFVAEIGVSVTVGVNINIGIISIRASGKISAMLRMQGPPISGYVSARFMGVPIKVHFGPSSTKTKSISMDEFIETVRKPGIAGPPDEKRTTLAARPGFAAASLSADASAASGGAGQDLVVIALSKGAATEAITKTASEPGATEWQVRADSFRFRIESKFAISVAVIDSNLTDPDNPDDPDGEIKLPPTTRQDNKKLIFAKPTHRKDPLDSRLSVRVYREGELETNKGWIVAPVFKNLPNAVWEEYNPRNDPVSDNYPGGNNNLPGQLSTKGPSDSTTRHLVGYDFTPPKPVLPNPAVQLPMFNAVTAMSEGLFREGDDSAEAQERKRKMHPQTVIIPLDDTGGEMRPRLPVSAGLETTPALEVSAGHPVRITDENAAEKWKGVEGIQSLVNEVIGAFRWTADVATKLDTDAGAGGEDMGEKEKADALKAKLVAQNPDVLVKEQYKESYMSFPFVAASVAVR